MVSGLTGRCFFGFCDSPASWIACSNPSREKTIPVPGIATSTVFQPWPKNPPFAPRLPPWKLSAASVKMARIGMPTFHQVAMLLTLAIQRIPRKLMATKIAIRMRSTTTMPALIATLSRLKRIQAI